MSDDATNADLIPICANLDRQIAHFGQKVSGERDTLLLFLVVMG